MKLQEMLDRAKAEGKDLDKVMDAMMPSVDKMLCSLKESHPDVYKKTMRDIHKAVHGCHYDERFAHHDLKGLEYLGRDGKEYEEPYWTVTQIEEATKNMHFPEGTTKWDKYVAFNSFYADTCTELTDELVIKTAYKYFFADMDAPSGKIWRYMTAMQYVCCNEEED